MPGYPQGVCEEIHGAYISALYSLSMTRLLGFSTRNQGVHAEERSWFVGSHQPSRKYQSDFLTSDSPCQTRGFYGSDTKRLKAERYIFDTKVRFRGFENMPESWSTFGRFGPAVGVGGRLRSSKTALDIAALLPTCAFHASALRLAIIPIPYTYMRGCTCLYVRRHAPVCTYPRAYILYTRHFIVYILNDI